ncbi:MAG: hypothetical protein IJW25_02260, partial [Clostridia bacterium]|nr:hypothetical protein [Clostridia bacterium]
IGTTKTARYGVELDLTDTRLDFSMDKVNTLSDVKAKNIAIKIENTSTQVLGAYFTDDVETAEVKTTLPLSTYNSSTTFTEETLTPGYAQADFSKYTQVPAKEGEVNGEAIVTMSISLLDLPTAELYIDISAILIIEEYDSTKNVDLTKDAHLALNVTEPETEYNEETLTTTAKTINAETYNTGDSESPYYMGLVNLMYKETEATALTSNNSDKNAVALSATTLTDTKTASFNFSVTTSDGETTAESLGTGLFLVKGNYEDFGTCMNSGLTESSILTAGTDYSVSGTTITLLTNLDSGEFRFCVVMATSLGMTQTISGVEGSSNILYLTPKIDVEWVDLTTTAVTSGGETSYELEAGSGYYISLLNMKCLQSANDVSFKLTAAFGAETADAETMSSSYFFIGRGNYVNCAEAMSLGEEMANDLVLKEGEFGISGDTITLNSSLLAEDFEFAICHMYMEGMTLSLSADSDNSGVSAAIYKEKELIYTDYVAMNNGKEFVYSLQEECEIPKGEVTENVKHNKNCFKKYSSIRCYKCYKNYYKCRTRLDFHCR